MSAEITAMCWVHRQEEVPVLFLHEHHRHPQAYGGGDDPTNLVWLCTGCHDLLHRLATMLSSGKGGAVGDALSQYLPNSPAARERIATLVHEVVEARAKFRTEVAVEGTEAAEAPVEVTLSLPKAVHAALKTLSQDYVHRSGRKAGLAAYITAVLTAHATSAGSTSSPSAEPAPTEVTPLRRPQRF